MTAQDALDIMKRVDCSFGIMNVTKEEIHALCQEVVDLRHDNRTLREERNELNAKILDLMWFTPKCPFAEIKK